MKLYLVQHAEAVGKEIDAERPLSEKGRSDAEQMARFLRNNLEISRVLHSGKKRAVQTAGILLDAQPSPIAAESAAGINPNDDVSEFAASLSREGIDTLVVGHLPFLARLVGQLLNGDEEKVLVDYRPGSIVALEYAQHGNWRIQWMVRPELLEDSATVD